jgi:hypothetical protein
MVRWSSILLKPEGEVAEAKPMTPKPPVAAKAFNADLLHLQFLHVLFRILFSDSPACSL